MAKRKEKSPAVIEETICPPNMDIVNCDPAEAGQKPIEEFTPEELSAPFENSIPGVGASESLHEQRQAQVPNIIGAAFDINAVIAKHLAATAPETSGSSKVPVSRSSVIRPVKLVHVIASEMYEQNPEMKRKDVIAACEAAGIATHTARTQYQIWAQAMRNDSAPKPAVPLVMGTDHMLPRGRKR